MPRAKNQNPAFNWELGIGTASVTKSCHRLLWDTMRHIRMVQNAFRKLCTSMWCENPGAKQGKHIEYRKKCFFAFLSKKVATHQAFKFPVRPPPKEPPRHWVAISKSNWKLLVILNFPRLSRQQKPPGFNPRSVASRSTSHFLRAEVAGPRGSEDSKPVKDV